MQKESYKTMYASKSNRFNDFHNKFLFTFPFIQKKNINH